ncbi:MAG: glycosyltransferase [Candidatus Hydrogenedens sp.]|nr:glycosyltransferase [Candidatus Hydrogenedens sp.]
MSNTEKRLLIALEVPFWVPDSGAARRISGLLTVLNRAGHDLAVFYPGRLGQAERSQIASLYPTLSIFTPGLLAVAWRGVRRRLGGSGMNESALPASIRRPWVRERRNAFLGGIRTFRPQVVLVEYAYLSYLVETIAAAPGPRPTLILDTLDVLSARAQRFHAAGRRANPDITEADESLVLDLYDALIAIQQEEAEELRRLAPGTPVIMAPFAHDATPLPVRDANSPRLLFVGGAAEHNLHALAWFLHSVWPALRQRVPGLECHIAGAVCDARPAVPDGVVMTGRFDSVETVYREADIVINPVQMGSGLKIKNIEAMAFGRPLVTTPLGAEGLGTGAGEAFVIAESPEDWIQALAALAESEETRQRMAAAAAAYVDAHFSPEATFRPLLDFLSGA